MAQRKLRKIEDREHLAKDLTNGGVINTDRSGYLKYQEQKRVALNKLEKEKDLQNKVESMEKDINNIKSMLVDVLNKLG